MTGVHAIMHHASCMHVQPSDPLVARETAVPCGVHATRSVIGGVHSVQCTGMHQPEDEWHTTLHPPPR